MASATRIVRNLYRDSVSLMQLSSGIAKLPGVDEASLIMATPGNLALLRDAGLVKGELKAGPNDLLIALTGKSDSVLATALDEAEKRLKEEPKTLSGAGDPAAMAPRTIQMARAAAPASTLALISTPGEYAPAEAEKALRLGLDVMLFSDNVSLDDEVALKTQAKKRDLLVMGPDCGTAVINGVPLGFANVVRRGSIGVIGASGTGLQQVTCLIDRLGLGISQAIGTGGHDLHKAVGGITMQSALKALGADSATSVIVLISKPPAPEVARKVLNLARRIGKPVVVNFIGADAASIKGDNLTVAHTLDDAAHSAVALAKGAKPRGASARKIVAPTIKFAPGQRWVRGLYSGGTFCYEASLILSGLLGRVWSNAPVDPADSVADIWKSREHTVIDLGDDQFTRGRPHPMIDYRLRNERIVKEAADPSVAVILLDVVLGYGSHPDPAGELAPVIKGALAKAAAKGRNLAFVGFVCGTHGDPQNFTRQQKALRDAGMHLCDSNAHAVRLAAALAPARGGKRS